MACRRGGRSKNLLILLMCSMVLLLTESALIINEVAHLSFESETFQTAQQVTIQQKAQIVDMLCTMVKLLLVWMESSTLTHGMVKMRISCNVHAAYDRLIKH